MLPAGLGESLCDSADLVRRTGTGLDCLPVLGEALPPSGPWARFLPGLGVGVGVPDCDGMLATECALCL